MAFSNYEELMAAVAERRNDLLTLELDLSTEYSQEHEDAKRELAQAKGLNMLTGNQAEFLASGLEELEAKVEATRPEQKLVWVKFKRLDLMAWAVLMKQNNLTPMEQYEKVLPKTFVGVFGEADAAEPLSDDHRLLSSNSETAILPGGALHQVVQAFMSWQNSGGGVSIRPTKSGQD